MFQSALILVNIGPGQQLESIYIAPMKSVKSLNWIRVGRFTSVGIHLKKWVSFSPLLLTGEGKKGNRYPVINTITQTNTCWAKPRNQVTSFLMPPPTGNSALNYQTVQLADVNVKHPLAFGRLWRLMVQDKALNRSFSSVAHPAAEHFWHRSLSSALLREAKRQDREGGKSP